MPTPSMCDYAIKMLSCAPKARAHIKGGSLYPCLEGYMWFYTVKRGTLVIAEVFNLPKGAECEKTGPFGFHIHEGSDCGSGCDGEFADAKSHYNPEGEKHPFHAGDMPVLFGDNGYAYLSFISDRFASEEVIGRTVIIHRCPDDFKSQPSGNSGAMIACGEIRCVN